MREKLEKDGEHVVREGRSARSWNSEGDGEGVVSKACFQGWGVEERSKVMQHYKRASQGARSKCEGVGEKEKAR